MANQKRFGGPRSHHINPFSQRTTSKTSHPVLVIVRLRSRPNWPTCCALVLLQMPRTFWFFFQRHHTAAVIPYCPQVLTYPSSDGWSLATPYPAFELVVRCAHPSHLAQGHGGFLADFAHASAHNDFSQPGRRRAGGGMPQIPTVGTERIISFPWYKR